MSYASTGKDLSRHLGPILHWQGEPELGGWYTDQEVQAVEEALRATMQPWSTHAGKYISNFEEEFAAFVGASSAIALNGGGSALDLALRCLDLEPGDEVISCAINFHGTHLAVLNTGARLVLCEPVPTTLNIDPADVERKISTRTRAILVTHMNGLPADIDELVAVAERCAHGTRGPARLIFDAARCCGARYRGARIGSQGWMTVFSFQRKKLMSTLGEGGMITTDDPSAASALRRYRSFGDGVTWGSNFKMTDVQAAVGIVQLNRLDDMNELRIKVAQERTRLLSTVVGVTLPPCPSDRSHLYYLYTLLVDEKLAGAGRDHVRSILESEYGIGAVVANRPTYLTNSFIKERVGALSLPIAEQTADRILCPSLHPLMSQEDNQLIASAIGRAIDRAMQCSES